MTSIRGYDTKDYTRHAFLEGDRSSNCNEQLIPKWPPLTHRSDDAGFGPCHVARTELAAIDTHSSAWYAQRLTNRLSCPQFASSSQLAIVNRNRQLWSHRPAECRGVHPSRKQERPFVHARA